MRSTSDAAPLTVACDGTVLRETRQVAVETPVNVLYGGIPYAVMMMTPGDFEDFAVGFSLTEGIVTAYGDIRRAIVEEDAHGIRLRIDLAPERLHTFLVRRRAMNGRTSCGVCGIEDLSGLPRAMARPAPRMSVAATAIRCALGEIAQHQVLNAATRAMHAAAWCGVDGHVDRVREDVGRHNALDKLIGALLRDRVDPHDGFILVTSRCSYEMVEKAAAFGAGMLVALSAPTSLGISRAIEHGITLVGSARPDAMTIFSVPDRIQTEVPA